MAKQQVALVLSGGVSLGSYIAGALDELMKAFAAASDRYEIDIITGASAGATTAALMAHGLAYRGGDTDLRKVWVEQVDMVDLLANDDLSAAEHPSLLNGVALERLAARAIEWPDPAKPAVRAPFCADTLTVGMTIGNVTPLPYVSRVRQPTAGTEEDFVQYRHAEQETFYLGEDVLATNKTVWGRVADVGRASAAIPFVFPLVRLEREVGAEDDDRQFIQKPRFAGKRNFWYFDGGAFNNLPLDLAWYHHRKEFGEKHDNRIMVVVNPWRADFTPLGQDPPRPDLLQYAFGLLAALRNESSAIQFDGEVIGRSLRELGDEPATEPALRALPGVPGAPVELLASFALVMPRRGDARLRGNHLNALGAFLDRRFREYDFRRGAADAQRVAVDVLAIEYDAGRPGGEDFYNPDADPNLDLDVSTYEALGKVASHRDPARSVRQVFEAALEARIDALVDRWDLPLNDLIERPLDMLVVKPRVKEFVRRKLVELWDK